MSQPRPLFTPPRDSHLIGLLIAAPAYMMMVDVAAMAPRIPLQLGFRWQSNLVVPSPLACIFACLVVFNLAPVGNRSGIALFRTIGRIPVLARYLVSVGIGLVTLLLGLVALHFLTSLPSNHWNSEAMYPSKHRHESGKKWAEESHSNGLETRRGFSFWRRSERPLSVRSRRRASWLRIERGRTRSPPAI